MKLACSSFPEDDELLPQPSGAWQHTKIPFLHENNRKKGGKMFGGVNMEETI